MRNPRISTRLAEFGEFGRDGRDPREVRQDNPNPRPGRLPPGPKVLKDQFFDAR